jgi:hypothetical protein
MFKVVEVELLDPVPQAVSARVKLNARTTIFLLYILPLPG